MYLTIDVETYGLHGEAFAVGYVLTEDDGTLVNEGMIATHVCEARPSAFVSRAAAWADLEWLRANVVPHTPADPRVSTTGHMRQAFMSFLDETATVCEAKGEKLYLAADVPFPCETNFLCQCLADWPGRGMSLMPYPFIDVASLLLANGYDPVGTYDRLDSELPSHNPLSDARQSSRILHALLRGESPYVNSQPFNRALDPANPDTLFGEGGIEISPNAQQNAYFGRLLAGKRD